MIGVANGTALHRAAWSGDLAMIRRLAEKGADINDRNNPFGGTPMGWARYNNQGDVVRWIQEHCAVDLRDAVGFDLLDHMRARMAENPAAVHTRTDDGEIPFGPPLHAAARLNREGAARILLESGADRSALAGDGRTPLDVTDATRSAAVAALLEAHGGIRSRT
jgi:ankyrin repeat protein